MFFCENFFLKFQSFIICENVFFSKNLGRLMLSKLFVFQNWITYDPHISCKNFTTKTQAKNFVRWSQVKVKPFFSNALILHSNFKVWTKVLKVCVFWQYSSQNAPFRKSLTDQNHKWHFVPKNDNLGNRQTQVDKVFQKKHIFRV